MPQSYEDRKEGSRHKSHYAGVVLALLFKKVANLPKLDSISGHNLEGRVKEVTTPNVESTDS